MNTVKIKKIEISNFKGIASAVFTFDSAINKITGENGAGKTTIKNAFEWCLCQNVADTLPMLNNKEIPNLTTSVVLYIDINNCEYKIEKISKGKYTLNKETNQMNKVSNESTYKIDDIEMKEKDYKEKLANIIGNGVFDNLAMLTDKEYFNTDTLKFKWNDRRKILFEMCGVNSAVKDIINNEEYNEIKSYITKGYATSDIKSMLAKEKKGYKETQNKNNILIEQKTLEINELSNTDFEELEKQLKSNQAKLDKLQNSTKKESQTEILKDLQSKLFNLTHQMTVQENNFQMELSNQQRLIKELYNDCNNVKLDIDVLQDKCNSLKVELETITNTNDTCPLCKRKYDEEYLNKQMEENKGKKETLKAEIEKCELELKDYTSRYNKKVEEFNKQSEIAKNMKYVPDKELQDAVIQTKTDIEKAKANTLNNLSSEQISSLKIEISSIERELAKKDFIEKSKIAITNWKNQNKEIADKIVSVEKKENALAKYVKQQTKIILTTVNDKFKNGISWALYKETYKNGEGGFEEDCVCMYNNKRYSALSNGEKNIANLEVVKTLQDFYGVNLPIFSDNAESITIPYNIDNQIIELYAKKNAKLENVVKIEDIYN